MVAVVTTTTIITTTAIDTVSPVRLLVALLVNMWKIGLQLQLQHYNYYYSVGVTCPSCSSSMLVNMWKIWLDGWWIVVITVLSDSLA